jgi:hypothetical protein
MVHKVVDTAKAEGVDVTDIEATSKILWKLCKESKNHKEGRFVSHPVLTLFDELFAYFCVRYSVTMLVQRKMQQQAWCKH